MTSFVNHDGRTITAENATQAQLRAMLADTEAEKNRLYSELQAARRDIRTLAGFLAQIAPHAVLPEIAE